MARGAVAEAGATRVSQNGYHYTKTEDQGWRLTHHIIAEKMLGRAIADDEIVQFIGKKTDLSENNIRVIKKKTSSLRKRAAVLEARIEEMQAELAGIRSKLSS